MTISAERSINVEAVRTNSVRSSYRGTTDLADSIKGDGLRHPITLWKDGTLISGSRRHRVHFLIGKQTIPAVFVDTIEDAAKCLQRDNEDPHLAVPMTASEMCQLWQVLRQLDTPAAARRADEARRRGVELRRQTQDGKRRPGRSGAHSDDYVLSTLAPAFGISPTTAKRLWAVYRLATTLDPEQAAKSEQAAAAMKSIDSGETSISANYDRLMSGRRAPAPARTAAPVAVVEPVPLSQQLTVWTRSLPQLEGMVAGLVELGAPHPDLTWQQVGPVHARLYAVRRDLEKIIRKMKESEKP